MPAYIDFKKLAESIDIAQVADLLGIHPKRNGKELRAPCPTCESDDARALQILPETNSYRCYAAGISGDCISLYAHIQGTGMYQAAKALQEHFRTAEAGGRPATTPQEPRREPTRPPKAPKPERAFDAEAFAQKLAYSPEVKALGISEADASRLGIGFCKAPGLMRGRVCIPVRNADGSIAGYIGWNGTDLKVPDRWLTSTVVPFQKRA